MLLWMLACTHTAPPPATGPETLRGEPIAFSEWFAPAVTLSEAQPGRYRTALDYQYRGMISAERTFSRWARAETSLTIDEGGTARGCTTGTRGSRSSESRYVSEDGEDHVYTDESEFVWGFQGRWERSAGWLLIWVDALAWGGCDVGNNAFSHDHDGLLMCAQAALPGAEGLVCHPVGSVVSSPLREVAALPIGPSPQPQDGPGMDWAGREWLLLGAGEGLSVVWRYQDGDQTPTVELGAL